MTNKEKRKKLKEDKKANLKYQKSTNEEINVLIKILLGVIVVFGLFYLGVGLYNGEIKLWPPKNTDKGSEIQYNEILIGETFNRPDFEYYVIMYDFKEDFALYNNIVKSFTEKKPDAVIYQVDLSKGFSKPNVVTKDPNRTPNNAGELKVINPTLVSVRNHKIIEYIDTKDAVSKYLNK